MFGILHKIKNSLIVYKNKRILKSLCACGRGVNLRGSTMFSSPHKIKIGNNVHIGSHAWFVGRGKINIGNNVHMSRNVTILSAIHDYHGEYLPYDQNYIEKEVTIEDNVWIGMNVNILPGITIGEGAIIGIGTTVTKDVPPLAIVGSSGSKILKYRDEQHYQSLVAKSKYSGSSGLPLNN